MAVRKLQFCAQNARKNAFFGEKGRKTGSENAVKYISPPCINLVSGADLLFVKFLFNKISALARVNRS
jgi:hypothetical protein